MNFPNAQKGINKLIIASIISIVGSTIIEIFVFARELAKVAPVADSSNGATNGGAPANTAEPKYFFYLIILGIIIMISAVVFKVLGLWQAGKDEKFFKYALYTLSVSVCGNFFVRLIPGGDTYHMGEYVSCIFALVTLVYSIFIVQGIINIAKKKNNTVIEKKGITSFQVLIVTYLLMFVMKVVSIAIRDTAERGNVVVLEIGAVIASIVAFLVLISNMVQARNMMAEE